MFHNLFDPLDLRDFTAVVQMGVVVAERIAGNFIPEHTPGRDAGAAGVPGGNAGHIRIFRKAESAAVEQFQARRIVENTAVFPFLLEGVPTETDVREAGVCHNVVDLFRHCLLGSENVELVVLDNFADAGATACPVVRGFVTGDANIVGGEDQRVHQTFSFRC